MGMVCGVLIGTFSNFLSHSGLIHLVSLLYLKSITGNLSADKFTCQTEL